MLDWDGEHELPKSPSCSEAKKAPGFSRGDELPLGKEGRTTLINEPTARRSLRRW
jgi:hypothetical protein